MLTCLYLHLFNPKEQQSTPLSQIAALSTRIIGATILPHHDQQVDRILAEAD